MHEVFIAIVITLELHELYVLRTTNYLFRSLVCSHMISDIFGQR